MKKCVPEAPSTRLGMGLTVEMPRLTFGAIVINLVAVPYFCSSDIFAIKNFSPCWYPFREVDQAQKLISSSEA